MILEFTLFIAIFTHFFSFSLTSRRRLLTCNYTLRNWPPMRRVSIWPIWMRMPCTELRLWRAENLAHRCRHPCSCWIQPTNNGPAKVSRPTQLQNL